MTDDKKWCVYEHISPSGKRYFGITSQNPKSRWGIDGKKYLQKNINGEYTQPAMANALLKYPNWNEWKHYILLQHETFEYACKAEQCLIKSYKTMDKNYGYNCTGGGEGTVGIHRYGKDNPNYGKEEPKPKKTVKKVAPVKKAAAKKTAAKKAAKK